MHHFNEYLVFASFSEVFGNFLNVQIYSVISSVSGLSQ